MKKLVGCVLLAILAFFAGTKWTEYSSAEKGRKARIAALIKENATEEKRRAVFSAMVKDAAIENERLRAENAALEARLKDCKPVPETKRVVPRKKKPRAVASKQPVDARCPKPQQPKDDKIAKVATPAPKEVLPQKKELCPGGEMKVVSGGWQCVKDEMKAQAEAPLVAVVQPEIFSFAKAVDEEIGVQASVPMSDVAVSAVQGPLQLHCPAYIDSNGMLVPEGYRRVPGGGRVRCK